MHLLVLEGMIRTTTIYQNESGQATAVFQFTLHARFSIAGLWQWFYLHWKKGSPLNSMPYILST